MTANGKRRPSVVRLAWGLPPEGGLVVVPDEVADVATQLGLSPAERLTLIGLLRGWRPSDADGPVVHVSLDALTRWTGLQRSRQGRVLRELAEGFVPPLIAIFGEGARGRPREIDLTGLLRLAANAGTGQPCGGERVSPAGRNEPALRVAERTDSSAPRHPTVRPATPNRVARNTQVERPDYGSRGRGKDLRAPSRARGVLRSKEEEESFAAAMTKAHALDDDAIRVAMMDSRDLTMRDAAGEVWIERKKARRRT